MKFEIDLKKLEENYNKVESEFEFMNPLTGKIEKCKVTEYVPKEED